MRYCRFLSEDGLQYGQIETVAGTEQITHLMPVDTAGLPDVHRARKTETRALSSATLHAPVAPSKIVCVGRNYLDHAKELGNDAPAEPLLFLKPPSSIVGTNQAILRPRISERVDFEGELAVVIKKTCRNLSSNADVRDFIFGYTCANDVTARDLQKKDSQWTRAKGFDTFCPMGPIVSNEIDPWHGVTVETRVNGVVKQSGSTSQFIFPLDAVIRYISNIMTLEPGDVICTGTPAGVGPLVAGDTVEVSIQGLGTLANPVQDH
ncbi:MAG TPA: fumarylacetoacetate hydrolase family protein [Candidatus Angelobacter sp.]|nr:fumarylacetoacetate hydrolase family protein [Candidatus Angelobacter sp.]